MSKSIFIAKTTFEALEVTHASTNGNDFVFKRKLVLAVIQLKHFLTIALNTDLISEACKDFSGEINVVLK